MGEIGVEAGQRNLEEFLRKRDEISQKITDLYFFDSWLDEKSVASRKALEEEVRMAGVMRREVDVGIVIRYNLFLRAMECIPYFTGELEEERANLERSYGINGGD